MRNFLDSFIDMKIDECEESIRSTTKEIDDIERRLSLNLDDDKYLEKLADEYSAVIIRRHKLARSLDRLHKQLQTRNILAMVNDPELNKE